MLNENLVTIKKYTVGQDPRSGLLVSLPPIWLEKNAVVEGDEIEFMQAPGSSDLIIRKISTKPEVNPNAPSC
jgi:hypothetical protein